MSALASSRAPRLVARLLPSVGDQGHAAHLARYGALPPVAQGDQGLLAEIEASGLSGRGGAAFPTARKLAAAARGAHALVIANGTEGEPASHKDAVLLARNPHLVLDGLAVASALAGTAESAVAVARDARVRAPLLRAIAERPRASRPRLVEVPARFVAGEESAVVNAVRGGAATPTGRRPYETGALVHNVETLAHLALVTRFGAAWFRAAGTVTEPGTALATVSGAVAHPGVVEFEIGATLGDLLERCGGLVEPIDAVLVGGYFGTWLPASSEMRLANEDLRPLGASLGARVVVALPRSSCGLVEVARVAAYMARESAGQCGPCVFGLRALADALDEIALGRASDALLGRVTGLHGQISRRGACAHPDGTLGFVRSGLHVFAPEIEEHRAGRCSGRSGAPLLPVHGERARR